MEKEQLVKQPELPELTPFVDYNIRVIKESCKCSILEYMKLQTTLVQRARADTKVDDSNLKESPSLEEKLRAQSFIALEELSTLHKEVQLLSKSLAASRFHTWIISGGVTAAVSLLTAYLKVSHVARLQKENAAALLSDSSTSIDGSASVNSNAISHLFTIPTFLTTPTSRNLALVTVYTLAFLYTAQNEVSIRVARVVSRRLKRLMTKIERGEEIVTDEDLNSLQGWRWRVLFWGT